MLHDIAKIIDGQRDGGPRLVELGKIKIGGLGAARPTQGGGSFRLPMKFDHFIITHCHRAAASNGSSKGDLAINRSLMDELLAQYPSPDGKLRRIPIRLLSDDLDEVMRAAFCWYGRKSCGARSDGQTVTWFHDPKTMQPLNPPRVEAFTPAILEMRDSRGLMFKLHTIVDVVIASKAATLGGVYRFRTTSRITFDQLRASLAHIQTLAGGVLTGLPLVLVVREVDVAPEGKPTKVPVVHVEVAAGDLAEVRRLAVEQAKQEALFHEQVAKAREALRLCLPGPGEEREAEARSVAEEFHPEAAPPEAAPQRHAVLDGDAPAPVDSVIDTTQDEEPPVPAPWDDMPTDVANEPANEPVAESQVVGSERQPEQDGDEVEEQAQAQAEVEAWINKHSETLPLFTSAVEGVAERDGIDKASCVAALTSLKLKSDIASARRMARTQRRIILRAMHEGRLDWSTGAIQSVEVEQV